MRRTYQTITLTAFLLASLCANAQTSPRKVVLPNPQLIHCHSADCSQLWKQDSTDGGIVYPAQVMTDFVNGEVVGLTAVYDKSVTREEIRAAVMALYAASLQILPDNWRIESEQLVIAIYDGQDGAKQITYLKIGGTFASHVPSSHLYLGKPFKKPWFVP